MTCCMKKNNALKTRWTSSFLLFCCWGQRRVLYFVRYHRSTYGRHIGIDELTRDRAY